MLDLFEELQKTPKHPLPVIPQVAPPPRHIVPNVGNTFPSTVPRAGPLQTATKGATPLTKPLPMPVAHEKRPITSGRELLVNPCQEGNPILRRLEHCKYLFSDIVPDYVFSSTRCGLFISVKYHTEHPGYLEARFRGLRACSFLLRVVFCLVDSVCSSDVSSSSNRSFKAGLGPSSTHQHSLPPK